MTWRALLIVAAGFLAYAPGAHAVIAPFGWMHSGSNPVGAYPRQTAAEACSQNVAGSTDISDWIFTSSGVTVIRGWYLRYGPHTARNCSGSGSVLYYQYCSGSVYPSGTYPNATCSTCPSGTVDKNGACVVPGVCDETAGQVVSEGMYDLGANENALPATSACDGSCVLSYDGSGVVARQVVGGAYHYFSRGSYTRTSMSCTVGDAPTATASLPPASCDPETQDQGTINGSFTCLDRASTKTTTTAPPVTNPDGSTTETTTTTDSATGTDTVTTKTTGADGSVTETTTTQPTPGSPGDSTDFCKDNPSDPTCTKDEIPWGTIPEAGIIPTFEVPIDSVYEVIGGEGVCPADASVSFMGTALTWSYAPICTFAEMIRPLVLGFAWLSFGFIIVGGLGRAK